MIPQNCDAVHTKSRNLFTIRNSRDRAAHACAHEGSTKTLFKRRPPCYNTKIQNNRKCQRKESIRNAEEMVSPGYSRPDFPSHRAEGLEQCIPRFRHADRSDRSGRFAAGGRRSAQPLPRLLRDAPERIFLVLSGGKRSARQGAGRLRLSADLHEQPGASEKLSARALLQKPHCRGVLSRGVGRTRRKRISLQSDGALYPSRRLRKSSRTAS